MKSESWPFEIAHTNTYAWVDNFLNKEQCDKIIKKGFKEGLKKALVGKNEESSDVRKSNISWLHNDEDTNWLYNILAGKILNINQEFFKFDLWGLAEPLQFTNYKFPKGHYGKHIDYVFNAKIRKLSIVIMLSNHNDYKGGDLCLHFSDTPITIEKQQGKLIAFPSYVLHEVTPLTYGERNSLVTWVTGPNYK
jgi:PKHD-type hydroxylase